MKTDHKGTSAVTFAEVGGYQELKDTLKKDIIYPLHYPDAYENMELNRGFILYGPPVKHILQEHLQMKPVQIL